MDNAIKHYLNSGGTIKQCPAINKTKDRAKVNKRYHIKPINDLEDLKGFSCHVCPKRNKCRKLCPPIDYLIKKTEVEPLKELPLNENINKDTNGNKWPETLTTTEIIFSLFFFDRLTQQEIANNLFITQQYVSKVITQYKNILLNNLKK